MTYCLAACVNDGLVFVSDSRTNAGIDQLGIFSKMHPFTDLEGRFFTLLSAGNLATTQAVVARLRRDIRENATTSLKSVGRIREAADYVGKISREVQDQYPEEDRGAGFSPEADFIFGGKIGGAEHALFHIYSQGNYVSPTALAPFVQIGEQKYGKPILDRIVETGTELETVARCGLVSMDSTMRSNASVGPPIELMIYRAGSPGTFTHIVYSDNDPYLREISEAWATNLRLAFDKLPALKLPPTKVRLVDH
jgi:putative proteasome-type protease